MVDACLKPEEYRLLIFHDHSHQRDGVVEPCYPERYVDKKKFLTRVVRLPGAVRDAAMPFCRNVDRPTADGRVDFYPLLDERVKGDEIKYEEVFVGKDRAKRKEDKEYFEFLRTIYTTSHFPQEHAAHDEAYASKLASCLEKLSNELGRQKLSNELGRHWDLVAVVVPGAMPVDKMPGDKPWHQALLDKVSLKLREKATAACDNVLTALQHASSDGDEYKEGALFFGPVEQMAGLERPIVLLVGFQHSRRLCSRWQKKLFDEKKGEVVDPGRVDPAVYQALTRCSFRLIVVEPHARHMMRHYKISECSDDGMVPWSAEDGGTDCRLCSDMKTQEQFVRTKVHRKLEELMSSDDFDLETIAELTVYEVSQTVWERDTKAQFGWSKLPLLRSLCLCSDKAGGLMECQDSLLNGLTTKLQTLTLSTNKLTSVKGLVSLTQLKKLDLGDNQLKSVEDLKSLTQLIELNLEKNQLASVKGLEDMTKLQVLNLDSQHVQLKSVESLANLTQLQVLFLGCSRPPKPEPVMKARDFYLAKKNLTLTLTPTPTPTLTLTLTLTLDKKNEKKAATSWTAMRTEDRAEYEKEYAAYVLYEKECEEFKESLKQTSGATGLDLLTTLTRLHLYHSKLTSVKGLERMTLLQILNLNHNRLREVEDLKSLEQLEELYLRKNLLTSMKGLKSLKKLRKLDLNHNKLCEYVNLVEDLKSLEELEMLHLNNNELKSVNGLGSLTKLRQLHLAHNKLEYGNLVEDLTLLEQHALEELDLGDNQLTEEELSSLRTSLKKLRVSNSTSSAGSDGRTPPLATKAGAVRFMSWAALVGWALCPICRDAPQARESGGV